VQQRNALNVIYSPPTGPRLLDDCHSISPCPYVALPRRTPLVQPPVVHAARRPALRTPVSLSPSFSAVPPALLRSKASRRSCKWPVPRRTMRRITIANAVLRERVSLPRSGLVYRHDYGTDPRRYRSFVRPPCKLDHRYVCLRRTRRVAFRVCSELGKRSSTDDSFRRPLGRFCLGDRRRKALFQYCLLDVFRYFPSIACTGVKNSKSIVYRASRMR